MNFPKLWIRIQKRRITTNYVLTLQIIWKHISIFQIAKMLKVVQNIWTCSEKLIMLINAQIQTYLNNSNWLIFVYNLSGIHLTIELTLRKILTTYKFSQHGAFLKIYIIFFRN